MFKKSVIAAIISTGAVGAVVAAEQQLVFRMQANGTVSVPEWVVINHNYTTWVNTGGEHSCQEWLVPTNQVDWGQNFQQSRSCLQTQERQATPILLNPILGTQKEGDTFTETRNITTSQFQPAIGTRDYITGETSGPWGAWGNTGSPYSCDVWAPEPDTVNLFDPFTQTRDCQQDQVREQQVFHTWASGAQTPKRIDSGNQTITVTESRANQGTRDYITGERLGAWTPWVNVGGHYDCGTWTPAPGSQMANFTQTRDCSQDQTGSREVFNVFRSGAETFNRTEPRNQTITEVESRSVTATAGSWSNTTVQNCGTWGPAPTTQTSSFTQTRTCDQNQARTWTYTSGGNIGTYTEQRTVEGSATESRTVTVSWTEWSNSGAPKNHSAYTPAASNQTANFVQTRNYEQPQTRSRNYSTGDTFTETRDLASVENRNVTVAVNAWSNTTVQNCSATWSPAPGAQMANFTQTRVCDQNQTRTWTYVADGSTIHTRTENQTVAGAGSESRTVTATAGTWANVGAQSCTAWGPAAASQTANFTQTRTCTQERERVWTYTAGGTTIGTHTETGSVAGAGPTSQTITVSWTAWANSGSPYSCTAWSPSTGSVNFGQSFTQSRDCSQNQTRTRNYSEGSSFGESQTVTITQTQGATGTYQNWVSTSPSCGGWSYGGYSYGSWSPAGTTQTSSFTQTRSYSRPMSRSCQPREYDTVTGSFRNVGSAYTENSTDSGTESRTVTVAWTNWVQIGQPAPTDCTAWTPSESDVNLGQSFTQTRNCWKTYYRERWYSSGEGYGEYDSRFEGESRSAVGSRNYVVNQSSSAGSWVNSGGVYNCSGWSPSPSGYYTDQSFTQTRSCSQNQSRTITVYNNWANGSQTVSHTYGEGQTITVTESQTAWGTMSRRDCSGTYTYYHEYDYGNDRVIQEWSLVGGGYRRCESYRGSPFSCTGSSVPSNQSVGGMRYELYDNDYYFAEYEICRN